MSEVTILTEYKDILLIEDVMDILQIGKNTAYGLIKDGAIQAIKIGKQYRIPKKNMINFILQKSN